ncbi:MAG: hypothetical protein ACTSO9_14895 [Candidatus Helarchaeota archaeon]
MSRILNRSNNKFNSKYVISLSAPRFFNKIAKVQFRPTSLKVLNHFTGLQNSIASKKGTITKKDLFSLLEIFSQMISLRHGHNLVEVDDVQTAITFYYHLAHCSQVSPLIKGDFSILFKTSSSNQIKAKDKIHISKPAIQQLNLVKEKFGAMLEKRSDDILERLNSCILLLSSLQAKNDKITRRDVDKSYSLLRYLLFRTHILEFDTIYDYFRLINSDVFKKMNLIRITEDAHGLLKKSVHIVSDQYNSNSLIFPNDKLVKLAVNKFPILTLIKNIARIYGLKNNIFTIDTLHIKKILKIYEFLLNKFHFFKNLQNQTINDVQKLYSEKLNLDVPPKTQNFIFRLRRNLTISMNDLVGRKEMLFNFSPLTSQIFTSIITLGALCSCRFKHESILVEDIKLGIRIYTYLLLDSNFKDEIL